MTLYAIVHGSMEQLIANNVKNFIKEPRKKKLNL